jgi:hypothetical protein
MMCNSNFDKKGCYNRQNKLGSFQKCSEWYINCCLHFLTVNFYEDYMGVTSQSKAIEGLIFKSTYVLHILGRTELPVVKLELYEIAVLNKSILVNRQFITALQIRELLLSSYVCLSLNLV